MTTIPPTLLADLNQTDDPRQRATRLNAIADAHELAGLPTQARLLRLVATTETLLANPEAELDDDLAWEEDVWWQLAGTSDRGNRADLLESIWRDWGLLNFGDDADILLKIAETERTVGHILVPPPLSGRYRLSIHDRGEARQSTDDLDTVIEEAHGGLLAHADDTLDIEAELADVYARAGVARPDADTVMREDIPDGDEPPSTAVRDLVASGAKFTSAGLMMAIPVLLVAAPQTPWQLKVAAAGALIVMVLSWVVWQLMRGPQR